MDVIPLVPEPALAKPKGCVAHPERSGVEESIGPAWRADCQRLTSNTGAAGHQAKVQEKREVRKAGEVRPRP